MVDQVEDQRLVRSVACGAGVDMCDHTLDRYSPRPFSKKRNKKGRPKISPFNVFFKKNKLNAGDDGNECPAI